MDHEAIYAKTVEHYLRPIRKYLRDPGVTEVMVNRYDEIYIEKQGKTTLIPEKFADEESYHSAVNNILQFTGKSLFDSHPLVDARLPDGSRVHVIKRPCARRGTAMTIRKFSESTLDIEWLIHLGTLTDMSSEYLNVAVGAEKNLLVAGGTSTGKTSLLNAISSYIPQGERIVLIEDSAEMQLQQNHVLSLETKTADRYGRGEVTIRDLFRSSLRLRPDRIVIGEVRGGEAIDMIQAMTSGQGGSLGTLHANNPHDALNRLETMALMSKVELPLHALRSQISSAIDVLVQMNRFLGGKRQITYITEVLPLGDDGRYRLRDIFRMSLIKSEDGAKKMQLKWTGKRSSFAGGLRPEEYDKVTDLTRPIFTPEKKPAKAPSPAARTAKKATPQPPAQK